MTDVQHTSSRRPSFAAECNHIISAATALRAKNPDLTVEVSHIDNYPGAAVYVRDADRIARSVPKGGTVLDWGCGCGQMAYLLANRGYRVTACDWGARPRVPELLDDRIRYLSLAHSTQLAFDNATFDIVLSSGTLEHAQDILGSLREISRILKPAGWFCIFRFPCDWSISEFVARMSGRWSHAVRFSTRELQFALRLYNFRVAKIGFDSFLPIFFGRRLRCLRPLREKLDRPITLFDRILTHMPFVRRFSTSIHCFAQLNNEYEKVIDTGSNQDNETRDPLSMPIEGIGRSHVSQDTACVMVKTNIKEISWAEPL